MTYYKTKWWLLLFRLSICNILPLIEDLLLKISSVTMTVDLCMSALIGTITESGSVFEKVNESQYTVVSNSLRSHELQPCSLRCPWNSPGKSTGVGCHFLLQGIFPTQGSNPGLLDCRQILYQLSQRKLREIKSITCL